MSTFLSFCNIYHILEIPFDETLVGVNHIEIIIEYFCAKNESTNMRVLHGVYKIIVTC